MGIRPFRSEDAPALAALAVECARGESDFVLNPYWQSVEEFHAEFDRFGIDPTEHLLVADTGDLGEVQGLAGFLRRPGATAAGIFCPIVKRSERGHGLGGELLRAAQSLGTGKLGIKVMTAGIGTRNRAGYSLLTSHGFRPTRQAFLMKCEATPEVPPSPIEGLTLEPARDDEGDAILAVYRTCGFDERSDPEMQAVMADGRHSHTVARYEGRVVGFAELETHWAKRPWVAFVGVDNELRDRGIGSLLVAASVAEQFERGATTGQLMLSPANRTALRAYEKVGFRRFRLIDVLEKEL